MGKNLGFIDALLGQSLMPWIVALPGFAAAAAMLLVPGLLLGWAIGLRVFWALSLAPVLTSSLVAASTLLCWWLQLDWHPGSFSLTTILLCGIVLGTVRLAAKRWRKGFTWTPIEGRLPRGYGSAILAGGLLLAMRYAQIVEHPSNVNQGIDTPFHLNLAKNIIHTGDGSPYSVRSLMGDESGLYPQIWHGLLALIAGATRLPLIEAANALNLAVVAIAWPLGVLLFVHVAIGPKPVALLSAGIGSAAFFAFPFTLLQSQKSDFGPLFPYMLAVTFLPPVLSVLAVGLRFGKVLTPMPWPLAVLTLTIAAPGLVLTHMSALVALVGLSSIFTLMAAWRALQKLRQRKADPYRYMQWMLVFTSVTALGLMIWLAVRPRTETWDPIDSFHAAAGSLLLTAPTHGDVAWAFAALVLIGTALLIRQPAARWFLTAYAAAVVLYLVAAVAPDPLFRRIMIGAWYGDPPRLAALLPMFWAVFAGIAGAWIFERTRRTNIRWVVPAGAVALAASVILFPTNSETTPGRERTYAFSDSSPLLSPDELALMKRLSAHVPPDAVIANNPWDGSSTAYAIADRRVLFAHAYTGSNKDRLLAAKKLNQAVPGSNVCKAAERENIQFLLDLGGDYIDPEREEVNDFPGLEVPEGSLSFVLVDQQGPATLYRFVGCDA